MKIQKDTPKVRDSLHIEGGVRGELRGGLKSETGGPVDPEQIAKNFGVSLEDAIQISRRLSR
jgi:hypothetical protein